MNKNNNSKSPLYLCKNNNDDKCKKLIEMADIIVLNTLLKDPSYINENNQLAQSVIDNKIDDLTNQLIINPDTEAQYKNYRETKMQGTSKSIEDLENNLLMNGVGQNMGQQGMDEGMGHGMLSNAMNMEHLPHNIPHHIPHVGGGNRRKSNKKTKCQKHKNIKKNRKTYKKSKRIRKI